MRTKLLVVLALCCWASMSVAADLDAIGPVGPGGTAPEMGRDAVFCQAPDFVTGLSSQIDFIYPFDSGVIDDFMVETDASIDHIEWWGTYWNGTPGGPAEYFVISFFEDNGNCYPADEPFYVEDIFVYDEIPGDHNMYVADIPPVPVTAGQAYWVEIQAVMEFTVGGQWGWGTSADVNMCAPLQGFPLLDIPYWSHIDYDAMAFCLYANVVATDNQTWSNMKSLYR